MKDDMSSNQNTETEICVHFAIPCVVSAPNVERGYFSKIFGLSLSFNNCSYVKGFFDFVIILKFSYIFYYFSE